jgi:hypothetical protein
MYWGWGNGQKGEWGQRKGMVVESGVMERRVADGKEGG